MKKEKKIVVCLLSGGVDSTVAATIKAQEANTLVYLLSIYYGQGAEESEIIQSSKVAEWLGNKYPNVMEHFYLKIDGTIKWKKNPKTGEINKLKKEESKLRGFVGWRSPNNGWEQAGYPSTRDESFAMIAAAGVEARLKDILESTNGEVVLATTKDDLDNFSDIKLETFSTHLNKILSDKMMPQKGKPVKIILPLINLTKAEIIKKGLEIGAPLELTWSCYFGEPGKPCNKCDQCKWRKDAFENAKVEDVFLMNVK